MTKVVNVPLDGVGSPTDASLILQFMPIFGAFIISGIGFAIAWRRGHAPLGAGLGCAATVIALYVGHRLFGTPIAYGLVMQAAVFLFGGIAAVRQFGFWR